MVKINYKLFLESKELSDIAKNNWWMRNYSRREEVFLQPNTSLGLAR